MEIKLKNTTYKDYQFDLTIEKNTITGIYGEERNILLDLISTLLIGSGYIYYDKVKLTTENYPTIYSHISLITKNITTISFQQTIYQYMEEVIITKHLLLKDPSKKIKDSLKIVGLSEDYLAKELGELSSSEQALIEIACGLLSNPDVILLEDIFTTFDMYYEKKLTLLLNKLKDNYHKTIIISSPTSNILYKYTNNLIIIKNKKVLISGKTKDVYKQVNYLLKEKIEVPDIVLFTYKADKRNAKIDYYADIRDLIKDIYKHVRR